MPRKPSKTCILRSCIKYVQSSLAMYKKREKTKRTRLIWSSVGTPGRNTNFCSCHSGSTEWVPIGPQALYVTPLSPHSCVWLLLCLLVQTSVQLIHCRANAGSWCKYHAYFCLKKKISEFVLPFRFLSAYASKY